MCRVYLTTLEIFAGDIGPMAIDINPTAEASYARTLIGRGCPKALAIQVASILAHTPDTSLLSEYEESLVKQAYSYTPECVLSCG